MKSILERVTVGTIGRVDDHNAAVAEAEEEMHKQDLDTAVQARATHTRVNLYVAN